MQVTLPTPERSSVTVPVATIDGVSRTAPSVGDAGFSTGGTVSMLTIAVLWRGCRHDQKATPVTSCSAPSVRRLVRRTRRDTRYRVGAHEVRRDRRMIPPVRVRCRSQLYRDRRRTHVDGERIARDPASRFRPCRQPCPVTVRFARCSNLASSAGHVSTPDPASAHVKCADHGARKPPAGRRRVTVHSASSGRC